MKAAIIGLQQSGKTTVFRSLTSIHSVSKEARGQGIQIGNVKVPDTRLERLADIFKPPKTIGADVDFMDMVGARTDQKGAGLTPQVVTEIRSVDALVVVVRAFDNASVIHPLGTIDPLRDMKNIEAELSLTDMIQIEKRLQRIEKEHSDDREKEALLRAKEWLDAENPLRLSEMNEPELRMLSGFSFLSQKPLMLLNNIGEANVGEPFDQGLSDYAERNGLHLTQYCAEIELEISELEPEEQEGFFAEMGLEGTGRERLIRNVYEMLHLISFFTIADTEIRAWSIPEGTCAVNAAGKVHSDMERGFIRAEVINFEDFLQVGSMQAARDGGHLRLEGKDYEVRDGDLIRFRFNV